MPEWSILGKPRWSLQVQGSGVQVLSEVAFFAEFIFLKYNSGIDARMIYFRETSIGNQLLFHVICFDWSGIYFSDQSVN